MFKEIPNINSTATCMIICYLTPGCSILAVDGSSCFLGNASAMNPASSITSLSYVFGHYGM